jgi:hypothetical protein
MTPERGAPYGLMGFAIAGRMSQLPLPFPYVRGCVIRANHLSYGHRIVLRLGYGRDVVGPVSPAIADVIINRNTIDHSTTGIDVDANALGVLIAGNSFAHVNQPTRLLAPERCLVLQ